jgi:hypothetical protein
MMYKVDSVMKTNGSKLYNLSSKPLILAVEAGSILNLPTHWEALTEGERNTVFDNIAISLVSTADLTPPASSQSAATVAAPAPAPFNPGSMNGNVPVNETTTDTASPVQSGVS